MTGNDVTLPRQTLRSAVYEALPILRPAHPPVRPAAVRVPHLLSWPRAARPQQETSAGSLCVPEGCNPSRRLHQSAPCPRPAWRPTEISPAAGVRVRLGGEPIGNTGEVREGASGWDSLASAGGIGDL
jgi:hypothetical protein